MLTFLLQLAVIYVPALNPIFKTTPLTAEELAISLLLPALVLVTVELEKVVDPARGRLYPGPLRRRHAPRARWRGRGPNSDRAWRTPC